MLKSELLNHPMVWKSCSHSQQLFAQLPLWTVLDASCPQWLWKIHPQKYIYNIFQDEEVIPNECQLTNSDNEVNDDDFHYDKNENEQVLVGLKQDHTIELLTTGDEEVGLDEAICPSEEELHIDHSSSEEKAYHFPIYDAEREKFDPQLEVGKE
ncbi:Hypothetical predicted protein [Olea europaea subsp. europaea]|uniref:Uncharacterized protein n=1 Tax=Olea europaea subsp. europaea TaxID=158383 RepID=A0A8S0UIW9_OLEEU|nr:Hypothetical predicted protein [Olea europaea subsp. europaea]